MRSPGLALSISCLIILASAACSIPSTSIKPSPTPTSRPHRTPTANPSTAALAYPNPQLTATTSITIPQAPPATAPVVTSGPESSFCSDAQVPVLIGNFKSAALTSNGPLLASLVSPTHGMDARLFRNGRVVNYDAEHAKFLFVSTFVVDWGAAPASGLETSGSFHDLFVPPLVDVFGRTYTLGCDQVLVGGTTYQAAWPYTGIDFYSVYYPGTASNGNMDWHTWLLGIHYVGGKPYLYGIMQFQWEP